MRILILFLLFCCTTAFGQIRFDSKKEMKKALVTMTIVTKTGDSTEVQLPHHANMVMFRTGIPYIDSTGAEKTLKPYAYGHIDHVIVLKGVPGELYAKKIKLKAIKAPSMEGTKFWEVGKEGTFFLEVIAEGGNLSAYRYRFSHEQVHISGPVLTTYTLFQKKDEVPEYIDPEDYEEYFKDCQELLDALEKKTLNRYLPGSVVHFYNIWCN